MQKQQPSEHVRYESLWPFLGWLVGTPHTSAESINPIDPLCLPLQSTRHTPANHRSRLASLLLPFFSSKHRCSPTSLTFWTTVTNFRVNKREETWWDGSISFNLIFVDHASVCFDSRIRQREEFERRTIVLFPFPLHYTFRYYSYVLKCITQPVRCRLFLTPLPSIPYTRFLNG